MTTTRLELYGRNPEYYKPYVYEKGQRNWGWPCDECGQDFKPGTGKGVIRGEPYWARPTHIICCVSTDICAKETQAKSGWEQSHPCGRKTKGWIPVSKQEMYVADAWSGATIIPACGLHINAHKRAVAQDKKWNDEHSESNRKYKHGDAMSVYTKLAAQILEDVLDATPGRTGLTVDPIELFTVMGIAVPQALTNAKAGMEQYDA